RSAIPLGILQPLQHREYGPAREHSFGLRLRRNQQNCRQFPPDPVFPQAHLLAAINVGCPILGTYLFLCQGRESTNSFLRSPAVSIAPPKFSWNQSRETL